MSNQKITRAAFLAGVAAAVGVSLAAPAQADPEDNYTLAEAPAVCATLDAYPTFDGIQGIGAAIVQDTGWSYAQAGYVIKTSIATDCVRHTALWNRFVATYNPGAASGAQEPTQRVAAQWAV